jgi:hypothetical protein
MSINASGPREVEGLSKEASNETVGEELFIEELSEVRGGMMLVPGNTRAHALAEIGLSPPRPRPPFKPTPRPPHGITTLALSEEGTTVPHIVPMSED